MKTKIKRIVAGLLVAVMLFGSAPLETLTGFDFGSLFEVKAEAETTKLQESMEKFFNKVKGVNKGNYPYYYNGVWLAGQCHGFACDFWFNVFGTDMYHGKSYTTTTQDKNATASSVESFIKKNARPGDILRKNRGTKNEHSFVIKSINATGMTVYTYGYPYSYSNGAQETTRTWSWFADYLNGSTYFLYKVNDDIYKKAGGTTAVNYSLGIYKTNASAVRFRTEANTNSSKSIIKELPKGTTFTVTQVVNGGWGKTNIDGKDGFVALWYADYVGPSITKPNAPAVTFSVKGDAAVGTAIKINWSSSNANGYNVIIYRDGKEYKKYEKTTKTSDVVKLDEAGSYSIKANAYNAAGASDETTINGFIVAHEPLTVTFKYWDGTCDTRIVKYGDNAVSPEVPQREGYIFAGWDKSFENVTSDITVNAKYKEKTFTVRFVDGNDSPLGKEQTVKYGENAVAPEEKNVPTGYKFVGWDSNEYVNVTKDVTIKGIYAWENEAIPIATTITSAKRQDDGYYVYFNLTNGTEKVVRGRAVVSLKTSEGKLVETTESSAFSISANSSKNGIEVFVPCSEPATKVEVIVVDSYSSGVPIAKAVTATVDQGLAWSDWSDTPPAEGEYTDIETRTVYRYRDKEFSTSNSETKDGWTRTDDEPTYVWSDYGSWSSWSKTKVTESDSRKVETKTVTDSAAYTKYNLYYYRYWNTAYNKYYYTYGSGMGGTKYTKTVKSTEVKFYKDYENGKYKGYVKNSGYYNFSGEVWFLSSTENVPAVTHTEYRYADRSKIYTYKFYRWLDWSDWSTSAVTETDTREKESKVQYRYRNSYSDIAEEDTSGEFITIDQNDYPLSSDFAGKQITLFVYKVDEASDYSNEYVGQTVVESDGSYSFRFKLREEPSEKTGDFTVAIGIEDTSNIITIKKMEAPKPKYTVTFYNDNGTIIDVQSVTEGENSVLPTPPTKEGFTFIGWSSGVTNIRCNTDLTAMFVPNVYCVTFVDWVSKKVEMKQFNHGAKIELPDLEIPEGYEFLGWNGIDENTVVTDNMVVEALVEKKKINVSFSDINNEEIVKEDEINYGDSVEVFDDLGKELVEDLKNELAQDGNYPDIIFIGWQTADGSSYTEVTQDITLYPKYTFVETCELPVADVKTGDYDRDQVVSLSCATEESVIWYTLDGTNPEFSETAVEYTEPIVIGESCVLQFCSMALGKNNSGIAKELYAINKSTTAVRYHIVSVYPNVDNEQYYCYQALIRELRYFDDSELEELEGYTYDGLYYDEAYEEEFDPTSEIVGETMNLYAKYSPIKVTATFLNYDNSLLGTSTVNYGESAELPQVPERTGYVFVGWDSTDYVSLTSDSTFVARYVLESEYARVKLNKHFHPVYQGTTIVLKAHIIPGNLKNEELIWFSSDESVVTFGENNEINTVGTGTAEVTVMVKSTGETDSCTIKVFINPSYKIVLGSNAYLRIDSNGYLREIKAEKNTVAQVKTQFNTEGLVFFDINGKELADNELVGTGTVIKLMDRENELDSLIVVMTGDYDGDGKITTRDASRIQRFTVDEEEPNLYQNLAMDVNGDGYVNNRDTSMVLRYLVGKEEI